MHHAVSIASDVTSNQLDNYNYNFTGILYKSCRLNNSVKMHARSFCYIYAHAIPTGTGCKTKSMITFS